MNTETKHIGLNQHRLSSNQLERRFAEHWDDLNKRGDTLAWILNRFDSRGAQRKGHVSARDADVAASVIQWLGSPVGQGFLAEVKEAK